MGVRENQPKEQLPFPLLLVCKVFPANQEVYFDLMIALQILLLFSISFILYLL